MVNHDTQVQQLVKQLQGKYKMLGLLTSPVMLVGVFWLIVHMG